MTSGVTSDEPGRAPCGTKRRVYGYVRAFDQYQIAVERRSIRGFCERSGFDLVRIIEDPCQADEVTPSRSFSELRCALEFEEVHGLVIPELVHLSADAKVLAFRLQTISSLDRQLYVVPKQSISLQQLGAWPG